MIFKSFKCHHHDKISNKTIKIKRLKFLNQIIDETYLIDVVTSYYRKISIQNISLL